MSNEKIMILQMLVVFSFFISLTVIFDDAYAQYPECHQSKGKMTTDAREYMVLPVSHCPLVTESASVQITEKGKKVANISLDEKITNIEFTHMYLLNDELYLVWNTNTDEFVGISFKIISTDGKAIEKTIKTPSNFDEIRINGIIPNSDGLTVIWNAYNFETVPQESFQIKDENHRFLGYSKIEKYQSLVYNIVDESRYLSVGMMNKFADFLLYYATFKCDILDDDCITKEYSDGHTEKLTKQKAFLLISDPQSDIGFQKSNLPPPKKQLVFLENNDVICQPEFRHIVKINGSQTCIFKEHVNELFERGWAIRHAN